MMAFLQDLFGHETMAFWDLPREIRNCNMLSNSKSPKMSSAQPQPVTISVSDAQRVSGLLQVPATAQACYVLAHGAGAGMTHPFLNAIANGLAERGVATLRYQFPYMEQQSKRPDPPKIAYAAVRAAVQEAARLLPELPLFVGGKSFGGRMTSQAQAASPLPGVRGLIFLGFPLHPPGQPSDERAKHLFDVQIPMLFLQGTRDEFAELQRLEGVCRKLGERATLKLFEDADHSFHVPARSGRNDSEVRSELLDVLTEWIRVICGASP
jgi:predicted alpha/beta-hydrolase family hydrolase